MGMQDYLNMFFRDIYKPIPLEYNLVLAMLWRHPDKVDLDKVKVVHYCAAVCTLFHSLILLICLYKIVSLWTIEYKSCCLDLSLVDT